MPPPAFATRLLRWFDQHGRHDLPWQQDRRPYRVWVSEIMLQQTQVTTVIPYFERFMSRFPTLDDLARASEDEVLRHWEGLGYYSRARNLHAAARQVSREAAFPTTVDTLCDLPGIGKSTAGAIVSLAIGGRAPILDGNVKRVLARHAGIKGWPGRTGVANELWRIAEQNTPRRRVADYTQAIMDLGSSVCARRPDCTACPVRVDCYACTNNLTAELPERKARRPIPLRNTCALIIRDGSGRVFLEKRPPTGVWGGLWSFPECDESGIAAKIGELLGAAAPTTTQPLTPIEHTFTHFRLTIQPMLVQLASPAWAVGEPERNDWFDLSREAGVGLARPVTQLLPRLRETT